MKKLLLLLFIGISPILCLATTFYFTGIEDSDYANPANWFPFYPGTNIEKGDVIILQSNCHFDGFDIVVEGRLFIELGESLNSSASGMKIQEGGIVNNEGEITLQYLQNNGKLINGLYAIIFSKKYYSNKAETVNGLIYTEFSCQIFDNQVHNAANDPSMVRLTLKRGFHPASSKPKKSENSPHSTVYEPTVSNKKMRFITKLFSH